MQCGGGGGGGGALVHCEQTVSMTKCVKPLDKLPTLSANL